LGIHNQFTQMLTEALEPLPKLQVNESDFIKAYATVFAKPDIKENATIAYNLTKAGFTVENARKVFADNSTQLVNRFNTILEYADKGPGQNGIGNGWSAYNAFTGFEQNVRNYKDDEKMFNSFYSNNGTAQKNVQRAFDFFTDIETAKAEFDKLAFIGSELANAS
jgi:hypothetical protein